MALHPSGPWPLFHFLDLYTFGRTPWKGDKPVARLLPAHRTTQTHNKRRQASMPRVVFEPTILLIKQPKKVHASNREATDRHNASLFRVKSLCGHVGNVHD
jgi:hypothetical protein